MKYNKQLEKKIRAEKSFYFVNVYLVELQPMIYLIMLQKQLSYVTDLIADVTRVVGCGRLDDLLTSQIVAYLNSKTVTFLNRQPVKHLQIKQ